MVRRLSPFVVAVLTLVVLAAPAGAGGNPFDAVVSPTSAAPGESFVVEGEGCGYPLAGAVLLRDDVGLGAADVVEPEAGFFTLELTVPADVAAGAAVIQVDCGFDGETVLSLDLDVTITDPTPDTSVTTAPTMPTTAAAAAAAQTAPRFTG